jgi:hypothetical protein
LAGRTVKLTAKSKPFSGPFVGEPGTWPHARAVVAGRVSPRYASAS